MQFQPPSQFFPFPPQPGTAGHHHHDMQIPQFNHIPSNMQNGPNPPHMQPLTSLTFSELFQDDSLGRLQGLDISSKGANFVKAEGPSLSASESSTGC